MSLSRIPAQSTQVRQRNRSQILALAAACIVAATWVTPVQGQTPGTPPPTPPPPPTTSPAMPAGTILAPLSSSANAKVTAALDLLDSGKFDKLEHPTTAEASPVDLLRVRNRTARVRTGGIAIYELDTSPPGPGGGGFAGIGNHVNAIAVRTGGYSAGELAILIRHELEHIEDVNPTGGVSAPGTSPREHTGYYGRDYHMALILACCPPTSTTVGWADQFREGYNRYVDLYNKFFRLPDDPLLVPLPKRDCSWVVSNNLCMPN